MKIICCKRWTILVDNDADERVVHGRVLTNIGHASSLALIRAVGDEACVRQIQAGKDDFVIAMKHDCGRQQIVQICSITGYSADEEPQRERGEERTRLYSSVFMAADG